MHQQPVDRRIATEMKTYDINEVADFLKVDRTTALQLAAEGVLPGAKVGRAWVFLEDEVVNYLRDVTRSQTQVRRAQIEASRALKLDAGHYDRKGGSRRRKPPVLPEIVGEVAAAQVRVPA
jgi:excisionase family DNA binding protein